MTTIQMECFQAAARTGSFAAAAKELCLSVQVVSQNIQNLEKELSVRLFDRKRDGVAMTEEGRDFLRFAARWQGLYDSTLRAIQDTYESMLRTFRIGLSEYIDPLGRICGGVAAFARAHETTEVTCFQYQNQEIMRAVMSGQIDAAVMCDTQIVSGGDFGMTAIAGETLCLYISYPPPMAPGLALGDIDLESLCLTHPHLDASYGPWSPSEWEDISRRMSHKLGLPYRNHRAMPNFRAVVATLRAAPSMTVCDANFGYLGDAAGMYAIPLGVESSLCCVWDRKNEHPLIQQFSDYMRAYYGPK